MVTGFLPTYISWVIYVGLGLVGLAFIAQYATSKETDPREPPVLNPTIPFIGHIINLALYQMQYLENITYVLLLLLERFQALHPSRLKHHLPIFTLSLPTTRTYILTSPTLIQTIYRLSSSFTFLPFSLIFSKNAVGANEKNHGYLFRFEK